MVASESEAYWPVRVLVEALGFGALAVVVEVVGANAISLLDCAAADAASPSRAQANRLRPVILQKKLLIISCRKYYCPLPCQA